MLQQQRDEHACKRGGMQAKLPSSTALDLACHQKVLATLKVGLPASNHLTKKIPYRNAWQLMFWLILDAIELIVKVNHPGVCLTRTFTINLKVCIAMILIQDLEAQWHQ